jgi:DNA-binding transcriptional MocR family regulator
MDGMLAKNNERPAKKTGAQDGSKDCFWLPPLQNAGRVKYSEVVETVEKAVDAGSFSAGQKLPSQRELATHLGVTIATVTKAVGELVRRGVLTAKSGSGTFVADRPPVASIASRPAQQLNLALNRPPISPVREILSATFAEPGSWQIDAMLDYEPIGGSLTTRAEGAAWLEARGIKVTAEKVLVTCGAHEALLATMGALLKPGDKVLCEALNYTGLRRIAALLGIELIGVPLGPTGMQVEAFARLCRDEAPRAAVLTPVTHNPTATTLDEAARGAVVKALNRAGAFLLEDDIYGHLSGDSAPLLATHYPEQTIVVSGLSKCITPGLKLGYVSARTEILDKIRDALYSFGWSAPSPQIALASRLFASGLAAPCLAAQRTEAHARMRMFSDTFPTAYCGASTLASYHAWLSLPDGRPADAFANELSREGVLVSASTQFLHGSLDAPSAIRLSLGAVESRAELAEALSRISSQFQRSSPSLGAIV